MDYTALSDDQRADMLATIGARSIDELFEVIPNDARASGPLDLPPAASELELQRHLGDLAGRNLGTDRLPCFAGAGAYDHFIPAFIDQLISRGEFLTAYTPYQGEASQGSLQAFFEFQTQITRLTGMEIANASLYEGASAAAEAVLLAMNVTGRDRVLVADTVHPDTRRVIATVLADLPAEPIAVPATAGGVIDPGEIASRADDRTACVVVQSPNALGLVEPWAAAFEAVRSAGGATPPLGIAVFNPIACALLNPPGACGADIACGEGQPLGIPLSLGGPYLGLFAAKKAFMRKMPGRLVGQSADAEGRRSFCLALQTREQHIRGAKATSNVCTNQGLLALRATMYLSALGPAGLRDVAEQSYHKAHWLAERIAELPGYAIKHPHGAFFNEFAVTCPAPAADIVRFASDPGRANPVLAGVPLTGPRFDGAGPLGTDRDLLIAVTEKRTRDELERLVDALRDAGA